MRKRDHAQAASGKFPILAEPCSAYHDMNFYEVFGKVHIQNFSETKIALRTLLFD